MKKKILIVDDDKIFMKVLKDGLLSRGDDVYDVVTANDGEEGLEKIKSEKPNLVIMDLLMPKLGGIDVLRKLDLGSEPTQMPILISTQSPDMEKISEAMSYGIKGYIIKSDYSLEDILSQVETILAEKQ